VLIISYSFIYTPYYQKEEYHERKTNSKIELINNKFNFAVSVPKFKNHTLLPQESILIKAQHLTIQRGNYSDGKRKKTAKIKITQVNCSEADYLNSLINYSIWSSMESELYCFGLNRNLSISGSQFKDGSSYIKIEASVAKGYFNNYKQALEDIGAQDTYFVYLLFPSNTFHNDDFSRSDQYLDGIPINLREEQKVIADVHLKKTIYQVNENVIFNSLKNYSYADINSYRSHVVNDDSYYKMKKKQCFNLSDHDCAEGVDPPKILVINILNAVMDSVYVRNREKLLTFFVAEVVTAYRNFYLFFKLIVSYINLKKAKINILQYFFELDFGNIDSSTLKEKHEYTNIKKNLHEFTKRLKEKQREAGNPTNEINDNDDDEIEEESRDENIIYEKKRFSLSHKGDKSLDDRKGFQMKEFYNLECKSNSNFNNINSGMFFDKNKKSILTSGSEVNKNKLLLSESNKNAIKEKLIEEELVEIDFKNTMTDNPETSSDYNNTNNNFNKQPTINKSNSFSLSCDNKFVQINLETSSSKAVNIQTESVNEKLDKTKTEAPEKKAIKNNMTIINICKKALSCRCTQTKDLLSYLSKSEHLFNQYLNIQYYIKKMNEVEILNRILLNDNQKVLFDFLSYPSFSYSLEKNESVDLRDICKFEQPKPKYDQELLMDKYETILMKNENKYKSKMLRRMFEKKIK